MKLTKMPRLKHLPFLTSFMLCLLKFTAADAQDTDIKELPKRTYTTRHISEAPVIDGKLDDAVWQEGEWQSDFVVWIPDEGKKAHRETRFQIAYDDKYLYIAAQCYDEDPTQIVQRMSRRDGFAGDYIEIHLDTYHDLRTGFSFNLTAAGVKGDEAISKNGTVWDTSWNAIWDGKTNIDEEGWTAEFKIPFTQLRFGDSEEQIWGLQVHRWDFRKDEHSIWQRIPKTLSGWVSNIGELHGIKNIKPQKQLEIQPYVVAQSDTYEAAPGNPFRDGNDSRFDAGVDGKIGLTNNMILDFTINPDFGQVEADPSTITLDGFQVFFAEQRPFFIESKNIFEYTFADNTDNLFYSRRIGGSPKGYPAVNQGEFVDMPVNTTILGAAKVSGKTENGWALGLLESVTGKMYATVDNNGDRREELVEPLTNYLVLRAQKDFNERNSYLGGIFTATNRNLEEGINGLTKGAYTGGVDFMHNWKNRKYFVQGNLVASTVKGPKEAIERLQYSMTHLFQRVDANHVEIDPNRTSLTGTGGKLYGGKAIGRWKYNAGVVWRSPELELNDVGFLRQADIIREFAQFNYQLQKPTKTFRSLTAELNQSASFDFDGNLNRTQFDTQAMGRWQNNWFTSIGFGHKPKIFTNTFLRGGPRWRYSEENFGFINIGTDKRKKFSAEAGYVHSEGQGKSFTFDRYTLNFSYQPFDALSIALNNSFFKNPSKTQYVTRRAYYGEQRYILGNIDFQTLTTSIRFNYIVNPNLSIQYYGQPFMSRGKYSNFNKVTNPTAEKLSSRIDYFESDQISADTNGYYVDEDRDGIIDYSFGNPDFSVVQFRSNMVIRWEYVPGSEVYLVWSQGLSALADFDSSFTENLDAEILKGRLDNTFLIKATYRFML